MGAVGLKGTEKLESADVDVSLGSLADLTGFPIDYIKRELLLSDDNDLSVEELRNKVLKYLSTF
jgi:hypothetical protein